MQDTNLFLRFCRVRMTCNPQDAPENNPSQGKTFDTLAKKVSGYQEDTENGAEY